MTAFARPLPAEARALTFALAWVLALAGIDLAVGATVALIGFLALGPLIAAAFGRPRSTAIAAAVAVALAVALGWVDDMFGTTDHLVRVGGVAAVGALAVALAATREGLERARWRHRLIAEAGSVMSGALDYEVTLAELARLCARRLSDWCFVFVVEEDRSIRQLAAAHVDPERQRLAWELLTRYPLHPGRPEGPAKVIRTGRSELLPSVADDMLRAIAADRENFRLLKALGLRSAMITPLSARGRILGAIAFASAESNRVFGPDDVRLAEELSARAAMAVDNARLYVKVSETERELRRSHVQLEAILGGVADAVTAQAPSGRLVYANDAAARQTGFESAAEMLAAEPAEMAARFEMFDEAGRPMPFERLPGRRALLGEDAEPAVVRYRVRATGEEHWAQIKATAILDEDGRPVLAINVIEDVTDHREREESQRFLADASGALASSLDVNDTFPRVAQLAARKFAGWCSIEATEPSGDLRTIAVAHGAAQRELVEEVLRRYPPGATGSLLTGPVADGRSRLVEQLDDAQIAATARDPEHLALLRQLRPRSAMTVPMTVRGAVIGAISVVTASDGRRLDDDALLLVEELAGRCALALDNARLYEERSRIARTLQQSLLPPLVPELPGLDVATRFRAAGSGIEVGGDFYDLFQVGDSGWAVAIGDVCGKGASAAAITALARYTVRAAAMSEADPSQILALLNEALLRQDGERRFCTVLYGRFSQNGRGTSFEFASGGHPLPLLLSARDGSREVGAPGTLLGIVADPALSDAGVTLGPGDALVLYTDGVTDAGAPARIWTPAELASAVGPTAGLSADAIADRVLRAALDTAAGEPRDDIAIIVMKVPEPAAQEASGAAVG